MQYRTDKEPRAVVRLPEATPLPYRYEEGLVRFFTDPLTVYDLYAIRF